MWVKITLFWLVQCNAYPSMFFAAVQSLSSLIFFSGLVSQLDVLWQSLLCCRMTTSKFLMVCFWIVKWKDSFLSSDYEKKQEKRKRIAQTKNPLGGNKMWNKNVKVCGKLAEHDGLVHHWTLKTWTSLAHPSEGRRKIYRTKEKQGRYTRYWLKDSFKQNNLL